MSRAVRRLEVRGHPLVEGEHGGGGAELRPHVADRALAGRADRLGSGTEVLDDLVGAALDRQDAAEVRDHVLGRRPPGQLSREMHAHELRVEHLPRQPGHDLAAVDSPDADGQHAEAAPVRGVRVGADHEAARECVVLQDHLVDDPRPRLPEADPVLLGGRVEELVDLVVLGHRPAHVLRRTRLRADEVVAVDRRGDRDPGLVRLHELEQRHLAGGVLHGHAVDAEPEGGRAPLPGLGTPVVDVGDQDLFAERQRAVPVAPGPGETLRHRSVEGANRVDHGRAPQSNRLPPSRTGGALDRAHMLLPSTQGVKPGQALTSKQFLEVGHSRYVPCSQAWPSGQHSSFRASVDHFIARGASGRLATAKVARGPRNAARERSEVWVVTPTGPTLRRDRRRT